MKAGSPLKFNNGALTRVETAQGDEILRPDPPATSTEFDYDKMGRVVKHLKQHRDSNLQSRIRLQLGGTIDE